MTRALTYPFTIEQVQALKRGQRVVLNGRLFTGRDRLHKHLFEGGACPVSLADGAIYHCGPVMVYKERQWTVVAAGPTTSVREEPYMARIIREHGVRMIIGKGGMGEMTSRACREYGCVYLQAVGGAAAVLANTVKHVAGVHFLKEFGCADALWELDVAGFEAVVAIDAKGLSLHKRVKQASIRALNQLMKA